MVNKALESEPSDFDACWVLLIAWQNFLQSQWALCFLEHRFIKPLWWLSEKMWPSLSGAAWCIYSHWSCFWRSVWMLNNGVEEITLQSCRVFCTTGPSAYHPKDKSFLFLVSEYFITGCASAFGCERLPLKQPCDIPAACSLGVRKEIPIQRHKIKNVLWAEAEWQREGKPHWCLGL